MHVRILVDERRDINGTLAQTFELALLYVNLGLSLTTLHYSLLTYQVLYRCDGVVVDLRPRWICLSTLSLSRHLAYLTRFECMDLRTVAAQSSFLGILYRISYLKRHALVHNRHRIRVRLINSPQSPAYTSTSPSTSPSTSSHHRHRHLHMSLRLTPTARLALPVVSSAIKAMFRFR
jgi:hypothetical protein